MNNGIIPLLDWKQQKAFNKKHDNHECIHLDDPRFYWMEIALDRGYVRAAIGEKDSLYLTPDEAEQLGRRFIHAAKECRKNDFDKVEKFKEHPSLT